MTSRVGDSSPEVYAAATEYTVRWMDWFGTLVLAACAVQSSLDTVGARAAKEK